jgi:putative FmdB family regulatory protein
MPTYEYECESCHNRFEVKQGFHDKPGAACPKCKKKSRRVFHAAPIIFKGSGFYVTDHSTSNPAAKPPSKKESEAKAESKPEPKSETKAEVKKETKTETKKSG